MFLFSLAAHTQSVVVGLDFGHSNIKAGMGKFSGVVAVNNEQSKKLSPSYFAYWNYSDPKNSHPMNGTHWSMDDIINCTWDYTSRAQSHGRRYPQNIIKSFFPILSDSIGLSHREAMASTLRYLIHTMDSGVYTPENTMLSLSVEPSLSRHERYALKEVARIANTTLAFIVDSPTAVANYYVLGRTKRLSKDICFIDVGATGTWASIFSFTSMGKDVIMNQKAITSNSTLGGNRIDKVIGDFLYEKFVQKTGLKSDEPKIRNKFYEAARITKERLSIDESYPVAMEDVIGEEGLNYEFTREEFNQLIEPYAEEFRSMLEDLMKKAKVKKLDIVEAIGGNSRPQLLHEVMANVTKVQRISHTLNAEEAVILGTTILGSTKSSSYRLPKKIKATTFCNAHVEIELNGNRTDLYKPKDKLEKLKPVYYKASELNNTNITIYADDDYERPFDIFSVDLPNDTEEDAEIMIKFGFDELTLPSINKISLNGKNINVTHYLSDWQLNAEQFNFSQSFIFKMEEIEKDRKNASSTRNDYELYLWDIREKLENDEEFKEYLTENDTINIQKGLEEHQAWLDNVTSPYIFSQVFRDQMEAFKNITKDIEMRIEENKLIPEALEKLNKTTEDVRKFIYEEVPKRKPWMWTGYESIMTNLVDNYNHTVEWIEENTYNLTHLDKKVNPETKHNQIGVKEQILGFNLGSAKRQKKPRPTPTPSPTPEGWTPEPTPEPESEDHHNPEEDHFDPEFHDEPPREHEEPEPPHEEPPHEEQPEQPQAQEQIVNETAGEEKPSEEPKKDDEL